MDTHASIPARDARTYRRLAAICTVVLLSCAGTRAADPEPRLAHRRGAHIDRVQDRRRRLSDNAGLLHPLFGPHPHRLRASGEKLHQFHRRVRIR
jgi:hypothetical protein